jgi:hypothetical protein
MFNQLIESGSHERERARRGRFFLGTLGLYGVLLTFAAVASVHAYNTNLGSQSYDVFFLPPAVLPEATEEPPPDEPASRPASAGSDDRVAVRTNAYTDLKTTPREPPPVSSGAVNVPPVPRVYKPEV